mgnify:FL=1
MEIKGSKKFDIFITCIFCIFLLFFQLKFLSFDLGVLTSYINNFNALNELAFWSQFYNPLFIETSLSNPIKYNLIANIIYLLSFILSSSIVFTILPVAFCTLSFYISIKIYKLYSINIYWAGLLSFLGLTSISSLPIASSLISLLGMDLSYINNTNHYFDLLASFSSSFVLLSFLTLMYLTLREQFFASKLKLYLPTLWCFTVFIHPSIFIFGFAFILMINVIKEYRASTNYDYRLNVYRFFKINILPLVIAIPYFIMNINFFNSDIVDISGNFSYVNFFKGISLYFILPFTLMAISSASFKIDPFEMIVKFWPIFLLASLELLLRVASIPGILSIDTSTILDRVSMYFLHFFYYVPFLSIIGKDFTYLPELQKNNISLSQRLRSFFMFFYKRLSIPFSIIFITMVSYNSVNSFRNDIYTQIDEHASKIYTSVSKINDSSKDIMFNTIDDNLIYSYLSNTVLPFNTFYSSLDDVSKFNNREFFSNIVFSNTLNTKQNNVSELNIHSGFNKSVYYSDDRQVKLLSWLNMTYHKDINNKKNIPDDASISFFDENYLVSNKVIKSIEDLEYIDKKNIDEFIVYSK